jgi:heme A synthase
MNLKLSRFAKYAWIVLGYNLLVIVYGAFVRASGSGAGCGAHWPLCNGVVVPRAETIEMMIEFGHRVMSGITLVLIAVMVAWAWRIFPRESPLRWSSLFSGIFIITEALIGAGLVLFELVAKNASLTRAFSMMGHLVNTFLLLGSITLTAWWASFGVPDRVYASRPARWLILMGGLGLLLIGASGSIAALGDTLFPASSLGEGFQQDFSPAANILLRLRIFHPFLAVGIGAYVAALATWLRLKHNSPEIKSVTGALTGLVGLQIVLGITNVLLLAPIWLQLVHLLVTTLIWVSYVLVGVLGLVSRNLVASVGHEEIHERVYQSPT